MSEQGNNDAATHAARRQLADWWAEWELDQQLRAADVEPDTRAEWSARYGAATRYELDIPADGDVRLLRPADPEWGPVYVLVLAGEHEPDHHWIPFSRFSVPAMESEWLTGLRSAPLRVLCGWNARQPSAHQWPPSWRVRRLSGLTLERQHMFFRALTGGTPLAAKWRRQQGPPLQHPADPRHEYRDEEVARLDAHGLAVTGRICFEEEPTTYLNKPDAPSALWQAAENRPLYGVPVALYRTVDHEVTVAVFAAAAGQIRIRLVTRAGLPCVTFDGGTIGAAGQWVADRFKNGVAEAPDAITHDLTTLQDAHGRTWRLKKG